MDEKKWLGSDLVFDIDANEISECQESGKYVQMKFCRKCGFYIQQLDVKSCPQCGEELSKFEHIEPECINIAKEHVAKLIDILENDLGFTKIITTFSGHRGFHVIVELGEPYSYMSPDERREIVSYIKVDDYQLKAFIDQIIKKSKKYVVLPPRVTDGGIRRRIARYLANYVDEEIREFIMGSKSVLNFEVAQKVYEYLIQHLNDVAKAISVCIDAKVTIDITHLIRVSNSVNGKTGWRVIQINNADVYAFELSPHNLSASDVKLKIRFLTSIPRVTVIDEEFSFKKGEEASLEYPYASYFVYKGLASIVNVVR
ncbi:MAG: DNA primase small subunit domain-containing protein [Ignisphaera sp.]|uniref:DNA primase n=1 Tax=Ignisphaera aggregans TaxID=334771 RepID=A0A7J3MYJ0_9CREN